MTRSAKHPSLKHLVASTIGFTAGYLIGVLIEGTFGWHAYAAGAAGNMIAYYAIHYLAP
jgi:hypothetical protein